MSVIFMNVWKSRGTTNFFANFLPKSENIALWKNEIVVIYRCPSDQDHTIKVYRREVH